MRQEHLPELGRDVQTTRGASSMPIGYSRKEIRKI